MKKTLLIFLCVLNYSIQKCTPEDAFYVAAVVEFPLPEPCTVNETLTQYVDIIKQAAKKTADILVFPENTLTGSCVSVPVPINGILKKYPVPANYADKYNYILVALSKAAKENDIYVVVNLQEVLDCRRPQDGEKCPKERKYYFNTNIVFDRQGAIIVRTRKIHLLGEPYRTASWSTEMDSFDTDFGVKFVILINFDLLFQVPQMELIYQGKVKDVIFSTAWYSQTPLSTGVQIQKWISTGLNINMLASGANAWEEYGIGGSGIYSGKAGTLVSIMQKVTNYRLLVAEVPKTPGMVQKKTYPGPLEADPAVQDILVTFTEGSVDRWLTRTLKPGYQEIVLDYQDITCKFIVNITLGSGEQYYRYRAVAFSGVKGQVSNTTDGIRVCSIVQCSGDDIYSCGRRFPKYSSESIARLSQLRVIGTVPKVVVDPVTKIIDSIFFVTSLKTSLSSLQPEDIEYKKKTQGVETVHTLSLKDYDVELYTFGFYGRVFADDGKAEDSPLIENIVTQMKMEQEDRALATTL